MLEKLDNAVFFTDDVELDDIDSNIVAFFSDGMGLNTINFNSINLDDDNFNENDPDAMINVRLLTWRN